ncbi:hypothetical protein D3C76_548560 [compost metagenome]
MQPGVVDVGQRGHLEFGTTDDQQRAVVGAGVLRQVAHQGFDQAFEQHFFRQCSCCLDTHFDIEPSLAGGTVGFLDRLGTQERVQGLQLLDLPHCAPDMKAVAGDAQVQVGARDQAAGDAHLGQLFMGQGLLMDEPGGSGSDLRLVEAADGGQAVTTELGDHAFDQQQLVAEGERIEGRPAGEAFAQLGERGQFFAERARGFRAAQGQASEQLVVGQVDVRRCRPGVTAGVVETPCGQFDVAQVEGGHAAEQVTEEVRRTGSDRICGDMTAFTARSRRTASQGGDEGLLGQENVLDIAVAMAAHGAQTLFHFAGNLLQVQAHEQRVADQVVAGIAGHRQVAAQARRVDRLQRGTSGELHGSGPGTDLIEGEQGAGQVGLEAVTLDQLERGQAVPVAIVIGAKALGAHHPEPGQAIGAARCHAV